HAWVYVGDPDNPYTVFDLSVGRSRDAPAAFLKGYQGLVHADGYAGYNPVYEGGAMHVGCWMHTRRYFFDARLTDPERAHEALARIRALCAVERDSKEQELTGASLAVTDATNQWSTLGIYLTDGRLTIDNGPAEQAIRPLAVGRRNWLHIAG